MRFALPVLLYFMAEIAAFAWVGEKAGVVGTLALVLFSSFFGLWLVRRQGLETLRRAGQASRNAGPLPDLAVWDGLCLSVAGVLFLIPGFVSDALGGLLLIPAIRHRLHRGLGDALRRRQPPRRAGNPFGSPFDGHPGDGGPNGGGNVTIIEGEFIEVRRDGERR